MQNCCRRRKTNVGEVATSYERGTKVSAPFLRVGSQAIFLCLLVLGAGDSNTTTTTASAGSTIQEHGTDAGSNTFTLTESTTDSSTQTVTANDFTGSYSSSVSDSNTTTNQESNTNSASNATFTETITDISNTHDNGNSLTGSDTTTTTGTTTSTDSDNYSDSAGLVSVTESRSETYSTTDTGNTISGDFTITGSASNSYSMTETASTWTLTVTGSLTETNHETGNAVDGTYTSTITPTDSYSMRETGTITGGAFTETVTGTDTATTTETGNSDAQTLSRTIAVSGSYVRTDTGPLGSGSGSIASTLTETADSRSGIFSDTTTGTNRYSLLEKFTNVANTGSSTSPGNMEFQPIGAAFQDGNPAYDARHGRNQPSGPINLDGTNTQFLVSLDNTRNVMSGSLPIYSYYYDGRYRNAQEALALSEPYVRGGVFFVAAWWIMGPAALLGSAGPALAAAGTAGPGLVENVMNGADPGKIVADVGQDSFIGAASSLVTGVGPGSRGPTRSPLNFGRSGQCWWSCFTGETPIPTERGFIRWDQLCRGDKVLSGDEFDAKGRLSYKKVQEILVNYTRIWHVEVHGRTIRTTAEHPFFVFGKGWVPCHQLQAGDRLRSDNGRMIAVGCVYDSGVDERVYNCRVEEYHTYFVGSEDWGFSVWAHNAYDAGKRIPASEKRARDIARRIERDLGKDARRAFHDAKEGGVGDRTLAELLADARALYEAAGKAIPGWLR